jgi:hypothetical protein
MDAIKIYYDADRKTVTVWFGDPNKEFIAEETRRKFIIIKDRDKNVIGFEMLNYTLESGQDLEIEAVAV